MQKVLIRKTMNVEHRSLKNAMWMGGWFLPPDARAEGGTLFWLILPLLLVAFAVQGCVTKSKAKAQVQAAFLAGQQQAIIRMSQPHQPVVTFIGPVRNPTVTWSEDLTLAKAIVMAGYEPPSDPRQIMIVRNGQAIQVDPKKLLAGEDVPLVAGDLVQIGQ